MPRPAHVLAPLLLVILAIAAIAIAAPPRPRYETYQETLSGIQALRELHFKKRYDDCEWFACRFLWQNIRQPEAMYLLGSSIDWQERPDEAAAWYTLYLRCLDEKKGWLETDLRYRRVATNRLKLLKLDAATLDAEYQAAAANARSFTRPEEVNDAWMSQAQANMQALQRLRFYKGSRLKLKGMPDDWIHHHQGAMHRSGLKYVEHVEGRGGVLYVPTRIERGEEEEKEAVIEDEEQDDRPADVGLSRRCRVLFRDPGGKPFLRIGVRADGHPFELRIRVAEDEIFRQEIPADAWSDLRIDLPADTSATQPAQAKPIELHFILLENLSGPEGAWIDYIDGFEN